MYKFHLILYIHMANIQFKQLEFP